MKGMLSRHDVARTLGRRVSRGEFERIFSKLVRVSLPNGGSVLKRPLDSPKARRKARE